MKLFKYTMALAAALALNVNAGTDANPALSGIPEILASSTSAELPAQAAKLVAQADAKSLQATTIAVVKAAVGLNPAAAALIVGSIAQSTPAMAATAAATAAALVPNQAPAIARAAASSAPAKAGTIVEAVCRVLPASYEVVADAVSDVVPSASKEILAGIAAAIPELQSEINQALAGYSAGNVPSVESLLAQVEIAQNAANMASGASEYAQGPSHGAAPPPPTPPPPPVIISPIQIAPAAPTAQSTYNAP
jgi:hypothetical protein